MTLPLKRDKRFHQGVYKPKNRDKCITSECIFRSGLELRFFRFCDNNPNVVKWGSECVKVPYFDTTTNKDRLYYVDNFVVIKEGDVLKRYLVEVKPHKQTMEPTSKRGKSKKNLLFETVQYRKNCDKWKFAREYARKMGAEFIIITEKHLTPNK